MAEIARLGDPFSCGDTVAVGSGNVFVNGMPATRVGDATAGHACGPVTTNAEGSGTVFINNMPVTRKGDALAAHGTCLGPPHIGTITVASPNIFADS